MPNSDISAAWKYHDSTKHTFESVRASAHYLDRTNQPRSYKLYSDLDPIPLPEPQIGSDLPTLTAISSVYTQIDGDAISSLIDLTNILHYAAGITKTLPIMGGRMAFRAAACTGALYHIELYLVCGDLPGLEPGVYHFGVPDVALHRLRAGDYRGRLVDATGGYEKIGDAPAILIFTSTFWRNSWKYQSRAYRHSFWDSGTVLANLLALAASYNLPSEVLLGFVDEQVNQLIDVDGDREVSLGLVTLGQAKSMLPRETPPAPVLNLETVPLSHHEVDYPAIREMHASSSLASGEEVAAWRGSFPTIPPPPPAGKLLSLIRLEPDDMPKDSIKKTIVRRGSTRRFERASIGFRDLSTILSAAANGIPSDFLESPGTALNDMYVIVNAVDGLESGTYVYGREERALELLRSGDFRNEAGYLDLGQELAADAAVNIYLLADLEPILQKFGNRGYRVAQLDASITAGKIYLASYALKLGATGLTFFDDDVTSFFSPHAEGKSVMFLVALGISAKRRSTPV